MKAVIYRDGGDVFSENGMDGLQNTAAALSLSLSTPGNDTIRSELDFSSFHRPFPHLPATFTGYYGRGGKRLLDILIAGLLLVLFSPLIGLLMLVVSHDGGPALFRHRRIGRDGRPFGCLKIRSMVVNAEQRLADILRSDPDAAQEWAETHKLTHDPRTTALGRFLRKTSLDELPQLWNVIQGDMSLVGPRPIVQDEVSRYGAAFGHYTSVRPGITGLWQVSGRNDLSYAERVALDVDYTRSQTLARDLRILVMTAWSVLNRTGR